MFRLCHARYLLRYRDTFRRGPSLQGVIASQERGDLAALADDCTEKPKRPGVIGNSSVIIHEVPPRKATGRIVGSPEGQESPSRCRGHPRMLPTSAFPARTPWGLRFLACRVINGILAGTHHHLSDLRTTYYIVDFEGNCRMLTKLPKSSYKLSHAVRELKLIVAYGDRDISCGKISQKTFRTDTCMMGLAQLGPSGRVRAGNLWVWGGSRLLPPPLAPQRIGGWIVARMMPTVIEQVLGKVPQKRFFVQPRVSPSK